MGSWEEQVHRKKTLAQQRRMLERLLATSGSTRKAEQAGEVV